MLVFRAVIHKIFVIIANGEDSYQTTSSDQNDGPDLDPTV